MPASADCLILCATSRLAQSLRWQHDRAQAARGLGSWSTLRTATVAQWLGDIGEAALLRGVDDAELACRRLDAFEEQLLWESIVAESIPQHAASFFDMAGMAATAMEANALSTVWNIAAPPALATDEVQAFLGWREGFRALCASRRFIDTPRWHDAVIALVARGGIELPAQVFFAGFDNISPQEQRLQRALRERDVEVADWPVAACDANVVVQACADAEAECRAVAQWAGARLAANPESRLGIVVPDLGAVRDALESALDDVLHPSALHPANAAMVRNFNFSLGKPLARQPLIAVALELLDLATGPGDVEQARLGELLRNACWSAASSEGDMRARFEAAMREQLDANTTLEKAIACLRRFVRDDAVGAASLAHCESHLQSIETARLDWRRRSERRVLPSRWAARFRDLLRNAGWPGLGVRERTLSSGEYQAREAYFEQLRKLAALDGITGAIDARAAAQRLSQLCNSQIFQAETTGDPKVQVVGMLEAGGMVFDAIWVMGMTDSAWPPAARPNPLLPAELQRRAGAPNASAQVQLRFAESIHRRLLQCAPEIVMSFARMEGATELRASPLLQAHLPSLRSEPDRSGMEGFDRRSPNRIGAGVDMPGTAGTDDVWAAPVDDSHAPSVQPGERVRGGTSLLRAQAICPAWAYFRYRLGARQLEQPIDGLDARARGSILHAALRAFWQGTASSSALLAMHAAQLAQSVDKAVALALDEYDREHDPLPPRFRVLEAERLRHLLHKWIALEATRSLPFSVEACEQRVEADIDGIFCRMQIDRVDRLDDGRTLVIDYKTGRVPSAKRWAAQRIGEPQLPIYAAIAQREQPPAGVAFARVAVEDMRFSGIAVESDLLPEVPGIDSDKGRRLFAASQFADWQAVLDHWQQGIVALAREVKAGDAAVRVADEADLDYCEVRPLLRLAERRAQWEAAQPTPEKS